MDAPLTSTARPLLPNEPRQLNWAREDTLTQRFLIPALADIEVFFLVLRARIDAELQPRLSSKAGKPYPMGQCLEITQAMEKQLATLRPAQFTGRAARGCAAFAAC